jgi:predicted aspartyl protease
MGTFHRPLMLTGPSGESVSLDGMIDTGAHFTVVPAPVLRRLGVTPIRRIPVQFADGSQAEWNLGEVRAEMEGQTSPILVLFGDGEGTVLVGAHTLEALLLDVDAVEKRLVPKKALLMTVRAFSPDRPG